MRVRERVRLKGFFLVPKSHQEARARVSSCLSFTDSLLRRIVRRRIVLQRIVHATNCPQRIVLQRIVLAPDDSSYINQFILQKNVDNNQYL